jgi:thioredoxin 1
MILDFETLISADTLTLVDFHATWCTPCRAMMPLLDEVQAELSDRLHIEKIDVDEYTSLAVRQRVMGVPTLILFRRGEELWRHAGTLTKEGLLQAIRAAEQQALAPPTQT